MVCLILPRLAAVQGRAVWEFAIMLYLSGLCAGAFRTWKAGEGVFRRGPRGLAIER